jgi:hypothetical protein
MICHPCADRQGERFSFRSPTFDWNAERRVSEVRICLRHVSPETVLKEFQKIPASTSHRARRRRDSHKAGLPQCTPHGLRKAVATNLAHAGATTKEIMAVMGHRSMAEPERYTRAAEQKRLATRRRGGCAQNSVAHQKVRWADHAKTLAISMAKFGKPVYVGLICDVFPMT